MLKNVARRVKDDFITLDSSVEVNFSDSDHRFYFCYFEAFMLHIRMLMLFIIIKGWHRVYGLVQPFGSSV